MAVSCQPMVRKLSKWRLMLDFHPEKRKHAETGHRGSKITGCYFFNEEKEEGIEEILGIAKHT